MSGCDVGESQFKVDIAQSAADEVTFTFSNIGAEPSTVSSVYFYGDGFFSGLNAIDNGSYGRVEFISGARPHNLPAPRYVVTGEAAYRFGANTVTSLNSINQGDSTAHESVAISFGLAVDYNSLLTGLQYADLRVGVFGRYFENTPGGVGFINFASDTPLTAVPVPPAVWLFGSGLLGLAGIARRSQRRR